MFLITIEFPDVSRAQSFVDVCPKPAKRSYRVVDIVCSSNVDARQERTVAKTFGGYSSP